jgi:hypothetical protein
MDRLDRLLGTAGPLLRRVDATLTAGGAPVDHAVWDELRRVRLMPTDAVQTVAALRPQDLAEAPAGLQAAADTSVAVADSLPAPGEWSGTAADAYNQARQAEAARIADSHTRLRATASLAEALLTWMNATRDELAAALAEILISAEAVTLSGNNVDSTSAREVEAAANLAARVLQTVGDAYARATDLLHTANTLREPA